MVVVMVVVVVVVVVVAAVGVVVVVVVVVCSIYSPAVDVYVSHTHCDPQHSARTNKTRRNSNEPFCERRPKQT